MPEWTRNTPWRQGHILPDAAVQALGLVPPQASPGDTVVIVASHDCDLAQLPASEPMIEVVVGCRITDLDGNCTHAKTARKLHLCFNGVAPLFAEFVATDKRSVSKEALAPFQPDSASSLPAAEHRTFQRWLAARYRRSAFSDEFETRLKGSKLAERITRAVRPHSAAITTVLFDLDEGEDVVRTEPDDPYQLGIVLLHATEPDAAVAETAATAAAATIRAAFKAVPKSCGIELIYLDVLSEEAMSVRQFRLLRPWRLEHISLGADPQQPVIAE